MRKKYIDTIVKLDNSKTIMMQIKWWEYKSKNIKEKKFKKGQKVLVDFSEFPEDHPERFFTDFPALTQLPAGTEIIFEDSQAIFTVDEIYETHIVCTIKVAGNVQWHKNIGFRNFTYSTSFLTERDKKDIIRGIQAWVNIVIVPNVIDAGHPAEIIQYIKEIDSRQLKVFSSLESIDSLKQFKSIVLASDGVVFSQQLIEQIKEKDLLKYIDFCKESAIPVIIWLSYFKVPGKKTKGTNEDLIARLQEKGVDSYMLSDETSHGDDPLESLSGLYEALLQKPDEDMITEVWLPDVQVEDDSQLILDYLVYNSQRIALELDVKAVVCFTTSGRLASKLSAIKFPLPLISFTKSDETYKYTNLLWWVKGYKISHSSTYENLKKIGKEMIRMIFKGNISLDDRILIVIANENMERQPMSMMNGLEIYRFKDM